MISVIMIHFSNPHLTLQAIESFRRHARCDHEIILIDNASDGSHAVSTHELPDDIMMIRNDSNVGFGAANNLGARRARGDFLLFLNNDTITTADFATHVVGEMQKRPDVGIAGPRIENEDGSFQLSAGNAPSVIQELRDRVLYRRVDAGSSRVRRHAERMFRSTQVVEWVTGAAQFIRAPLFHALDGFDERFFMYFEDKDLCARAREVGWKSLYCAGTSVVHLRGGSIRSDNASSLAMEYRKSQLLYYEKHRPGWEQWFVGQYIKRLKSAKP